MGPEVRGSMARSTAMVLVIGRRCPLRGPAHRVAGRVEFVFALECALLFGREVIGHDDTSKMIRLVLQTSGQRAGAGHGDRFAELILTSADGKVWPSQRNGRSGVGEAAFQIGFLEWICRKRDRGVADEPLTAPTEGILTIEYEDREVDADLWCS